MFVNDESESVSGSGKTTSEPPDHGWAVLEIALVVLVLLIVGLCLHWF
jgi:hypothetical protein